MNLQRSRFSAADSQLGAFYQYEYALLLLLQSLHQDPATQACIEGDDDITLSIGISTTTAVQTKRRAGSRKNLTDASEDLWGTLRVWADGLERGVFDPGVIQFQLASTARAPEGSIAALLRPGRNRDASSALTRLESIAARGGSETNASAYTDFMALQPSRRRALVNAIYVLDESPDIADLEKQILREVGFPAQLAHLPAFIRDLKGRWLERVGKHLAAPPGDVIDGFELLALIDELREQYKRSNLPTTLQRAQPPEAFFQSASRQTFVGQLNLIGLSPDEVRHAIQDFYRASEQRSRWIRDQLLHLNDTDEYEDTLREEWEREFAKMVRRLRGTDDPQQMITAGVEFFEKMQARDIRIRQDCTPPFIMRGSFHLLADEPCIGWHPQWDQSFPSSRKRSGEE